jgi:hypothetical protein
MWLPAFKYLKGLLALRGQFMLPSGQPYEGSYHKLYNGKTFTGDIPNVDAIEIFADDSEPHLPDPTYEQMIVSEQVYPAPEDYKKGFFLRYFIKDTRNGKIIEVKKETSTKKLKEKFLIGTSIKWIIDKPIKDIFNQGYLFKGAITRNKENAKKGSLVIKGLDTFITEYDKFADIQSDVKGYKFEELPRKEQIRIISGISSIQSKPLIKNKPRFKKKPPRKVTPFEEIIEVDTNNNTSTTTSGTSSGGGGGGGSQYFDEVSNNSGNTSPNNYISTNNNY